MNKIAKNSLLITTAVVLGFGFAAGANALPGVKPKGATLGELTSTASTPEITNAEQRVEQARAQVDLANKQVKASQALLRAAQADLKAASAQLAALKLNATAQGLVAETGMTPAKAAPVAIADKGNVPKETEVEAPAPALSPVPQPTTAPTPAPTEDGRIKTDFNAEPTSAEPIQLR